MKKLLILILIGIFLISLVGAYVPPKYDNVTIILDESYTAPVYANVTIVLGDAVAPSVDCWTKTNNIISIPNGCVYSLLNGIVG